MKIKNKMKSNRGFTIVELLTSLVILAMLMATVALAFNASAINYSTNRDLYRAMNTARQSLLRATSGIRIALNVDGSQADNMCTIYMGADEVTGDDIYHIYEFDSATNELNLSITTGAVTEGPYVLCKDVTAMRFVKFPADAPVSYEGDARNVRISMTVTVNGTSQTVSTAAVIRKYVP